MTPQSNLVWVPDNEKFEGGEFAAALGFQYLIFDSGYIMSNPATKFISTQVTTRPKQDCESHHAAILGAIKEAVEENQRKNNVAIDFLIKSKDNYNAAIEKAEGLLIKISTIVNRPEVGYADEIRLKVDQVKALASHNDSTGEKG